MNGIMDRIKICRFRTFCKIGLACSRAVLCLHTHLQILLCGIRYHFTEQLGKLSSMLRFLPCCFLVIQTNFRIALTMCDSRHCKIHTNLRALAVEVCPQISNDILGNTLCNANHVLCCPCHLVTLRNKLVSRCLTYRAYLRCLVAFIHITTYGTYKFHSFFSFSCYHYFDMGMYP